VGAALAVAIGIPAVRLPGLFLAVTTLAFSINTQYFFLQRRYFNWLMPDAAKHVERPVLWGRIDVKSDLAYYYVCVAVLVVAGAAIYVAQRQRSRQLRTHFGPEYEHALEGHGDRRAAERALLDRTRRVDKLEIRPLPPLRRDELRTRWQALQAQFVDDPTSAIQEAHNLLSSVMHEQGYPTAKFEEELELLSVHHPASVQHYREAHRLAAERAQGQGDTEHLRQSMIHYRALFEDLLNLGAIPVPDHKHHKENRREA